MATNEASPPSTPAPGELQDLDSAGLAAWSQALSDKLDAAPGQHEQFFNSITAAADETPPVAKVMRWGAFSAKLASLPAPARWTAGEDRNRQEEYCEWVAVKNDQKKITRVVFTCETPDYFEVLFDQSPDTLLELYRTNVSPDVQSDDLIANNGYDPNNRWNMQGALHMMQPNNTLWAAIVLAAQATVVREREDGSLISNSSELLRCGVDGDAKRNSDPLIAGEVNTLARGKAMVSFDPPIGLHLAGLQTDGWSTPDGSDPQSFWTVVRGTAARPLRAIFEVPATLGYTVSEIEIGGRPITSPSQLAEHVTVQLVGQARQVGQVEVHPRSCGDAGSELESLSDAGGPFRTRGWTANEL